MIEGRRGVARVDELQGGAPALRRPLLEQAHRVSVTVIKVPQLRLLERGGECDRHRMVRQTSSLAHRRDRRGVRCLRRVEPVAPRSRRRGAQRLRSRVSTPRQHDSQARQEQRAGNHERGKLPSLSMLARADLTTAVRHEHGLAERLPGAPDAARRLAALPSTGSCRNLSCHNGTLNRPDDQFPSAGPYPALRTNDPGIRWALSPALHRGVHEVQDRATTRELYLPDGIYGYDTIAFTVNHAPHRAPLARTRGPNDAVDCVRPTHIGTYALDATSRFDLRIGAGGG